MSGWELQSLDHADDVGRERYGAREAGKRSLASRVLSFLWGPVEDTYPGDEEVMEYDPEPDDGYVAPEPAPSRRESRRRANSRAHDDLVELRPPTRPQTEIHYPRSFDDAQALADQFKSGAMVIVDLQNVDEKDQARLVNFLCGVAYGLDGRSHRVNDLTFVFAPRHFDLEAELPRHRRGENDYLPRFAPTV